MSRTERVINFLKTKFPKGIQMFNTRNIVGDAMTTIYDEDGIVIDYCYSWDYVEIFGLSYEEFTVVVKKTKGY